MRTSVSAAAGGLLLLFVAGCAEPGPGGVAPDSPAEVAEEFADRAAEVAQAWAQAETAQWWNGFVPLEPLTLLPDSDDEALAQALAAGWFAPELELTADPPADGALTFPGGQAEPVSLVPLTQAWEAVYGGEPGCPDEPADRSVPDPSPTDPDAPVSSPALCAVVTVTGASLGEATIATSRGPAQVPVWWFETAETEPFARVAVAPAQIAELPQLTGIDFLHQPGLATGMHLVSTDESGLTYTVGVGACDQPPEPLVYETDELIVVGGTAILEPGTDMCTDQLLLAEVTVNLDAPIDSRPVLATTGQVLTFGWW